MDELLTIAEAAAELRLCPVTVRRYIKSGKLAAVKLSRATIRIQKSGLQALLAR